MARQYVSSDSVANETGSIQYVSSGGSVINETSADTGVTSTLIWTEANDTSSVSVTNTVNVSSTWTEANDTTSVTVDIAVTTVEATNSWTEANDVTAITASVSIVSTTVAWTEENDVAAITGVVSVATTITTMAYKNNTGSILANLTNLTVTVLNASTLAFVKTLTNQTTSNEGLWQATDALFVSGTYYAVVTTNASGTLGVERYMAS